MVPSSKGISSQRDLSTVRIRIVGARENRGRAEQHHRRMPREAAYRGGISMGVLFPADEGERMLSEFLDHEYEQLLDSTPKPQKIEYSLDDTEFDEVLAALEI